MNLVRLKYTGKRYYKDKTPLGFDWNPGDEHLVPEKHAKQLLRFIEFEKVEGKKASEAETKEAVIVAEAAQAKEIQDYDHREAMLLTVEGWDKNQLEAYARKYDTELDKRRSLNTLRQEVAVLIEQFGVR